MHMMQFYSPSSLLRFCCYCGSAGLETARKKQLVFLGSPPVAASVLDKLFHASRAPDSTFELAAIVTQPPSARHRGKKLMPSPVAQHALDLGFPNNLIFTPERAGEEKFLSDLRAIKPELCVTAAYGNILPNKFLEIPQCGIVNIHPSLLPLYRGAAPVQRALQDDAKETGVSLVYTVRALDAGPIIAFEKFQVDDCIKAPELLSILFDRGGKLLIQELTSIFDGFARLTALEQDDSRATLAPKLRVEESWLSFDEDALVVHNKVRAFAGWPGTRTKVQIVHDNEPPQILELKIITTKVYNNQFQGGGNVTFEGGVLIFPCAHGSALETKIPFPYQKKIN
ncbi:uncharacterized protein LOC18435160 isoform X2 [Amborella trichopoda]|uniref:uncharacterized protein LOC18435160 isoform X2 n=1 Tax=Amborella trichopoda TaxID=13333 RepID=UPI0009BE439A|nr:uncharacterized protein LOC18435160 isoform X2 [Amborella trichopoda]|eukprot:XP_020523472.1 uncharacterized protein LOC18435160 isoform X2 [Amborella trichopoda]